MSSSGPKLVCTAGPRQGMEFVLSGEQMVIGRANECEIPIPDTSVSRRHVLLQASDSGWQASDMGSGNGTAINGELIAEETVLRHGDRLTLGDTEFSFVGEEQGTNARAIIPQRTSGERARPPVRTSRRTGTSTALPAGKPRSRKLWIGVAVVMALLFGGLGFLKVQQDRQEEQARQEAQKQQAQRAQLGAVFQEGKNLVREGKWAEAKARFEEISAAAPNYPGVADYLARAEKEVPNQTRLSEAEAAVGQEQLGQAAQLLSQVSPDTLQSQRLREVRRQIEEKAVYRLNEARPLLDGEGYRNKENMKKLEAVTNDVLAALPDNRDAAELNKQAKENLAELNKPRPVFTGNSPKPWLEVASRYREGDLAAALSMAGECGAKHPQCRSLATKINSVKSRMARVEALSTKELIDVVDLDEDLAGSGGSKMVRQARTRLANHYFTSASSAKGSGNWGKAMEYARKTLRADASHAGAQAIVNELRNKSKDLYLQAYALKETSPEEAIKLFKEVVAMTSRDDESHTKAKGWIEKLARQ